MKLNDVRVLRNILGDKINEDDHDDFLTRKLPKFNPKKLALGRLPRKDMYGRNKESISDPDVKAEALSQLGFEWNTPPSDISYNFNVDNTVPINVESPTQREGRERKDELVKEQELKKIRDLRADEANWAQNQQIARIERMNKVNKYNEDLANQQVKSAERASKLQMFGAMSNILTRPEKEPGWMPITWGVDATGKPIQSKLPLGPNKKVNIPLSIPTRAGVERFFKGVSKVARPMAENLSYSAGGALIGEFGDEAAGKKLQRTTSLKQQYMQYLAQKYMKRGHTIRNDSDIINLATDKERARIGNLSVNVERDQQLASTMGFMGGTSGRAMISGIRRQSQTPNVLRMTDIGSRQVPVGSFGPESLSRLGVSQGLVSVTPENKWGVFFDQPSITSTDKLTRIIGKAPNPVPATQKLGKYMNTFNTNEFTNKLKKLI